MEKIAIRDEEPALPATFRVSWLALMEPVPAFVPRCASTDSAVSIGLCRSGYGLLSAATVSADL